MDSGTVRVPTKLSTLFIELFGNKPCISCDKSSFARFKIESRVMVFLEILHEGRISIVVLFELILYYDPISVLIKYFNS